MVAVPDGLEQYLEQVRACRAELIESLAAVREALDGAARGEDASRQRVHTALVELTRDFAEHVSLAERHDGFFQGVREVPRLSRLVQQLIDEHPRLQADLHDFVALVERGDGVTEVPAFREELTELLDRLVDHRRRGGDLLYEAFAVDLGGQG
jgi:hypothetical protein